MRTYSPKPEHIDRRWYVVDASGQVLGRLASHVALLLRGKHKPIFAPHMDVGDHVIVVNASKVELTRDKEQKKVAYRHSGYPGGIKATSYERLLAERPQVAVEKAVRGMLPKNRLGRQMIGKLHVVPGPEHPHAAQQPVALLVGERPVWEGLPGRTEALVAGRSGGAATAAPATETPVPVAEGSPTEATEPKETTAKQTTAKKTTAKKSTAKKPTAKATTTKKTTAKKTTAKKSTAKKPTAKATTTKKTTAKKTTAKKSTAKKPTAKATTTKKTTAKKTTAKKTTAKKTTDDSTTPTKTKE
jgi:large subunit ribosomal protein L13